MDNKYDNNGASAFSIELSKNGVIRRVLINFSSSQNAIGGTIEGV